MRLSEYGRHPSTRKASVQPPDFLLGGVDVRTATHHACLGTPRGLSRRTRALTPTHEGIARVAQTRKQPRVKHACRHVLSALEPSGLSWQARDARRQRGGSGVCLVHGQAVRNQRQTMQEGPRNTEEKEADRLFDLRRQGQVFLPVERDPALQAASRLMPRSLALHKRISHLRHPRRAAIPLACPARHPLVHDLTPPPAVRFWHTHPPPEALLRHGRTRVLAPWPPRPRCGPWRPATCHRLSALATARRGLRAPSRLDACASTPRAHARVEALTTHPWGLDQAIERRAPRGGHPDCHWDDARVPQRHTARPTCWPRYPAVRKGLAPQQTAEKLAPRPGLPARRALARCVAADRACAAWPRLLAATHATRPWDRRGPTGAHRGLGHNHPPALSPPDGSWALSPTAGPQSRRLRRRPTARCCKRAESSAGCARCGKTGSSLRSPLRGGKPERSGRSRTAPGHQDHAPEVHHGRAHPHRPDEERHGARCTCDRTAALPCGALQYMGTGRFMAQHRSPEVCLLKKCLHFLQNTNAGGEPRPRAAARHERRLLGVGSSAWLGGGSERQSWIKRYDSQGYLVVQDQPVCRWQSRLPGRSRHLQLPIA